MVAQYYHPQINLGQKVSSLTWRADRFSGYKVTMNGN
jgi:hypothetical protein